MYKSIIRPILFCFDPEKIHHFIFACIQWMNRIPGVSILISKIFVVQHPALHRKVFGIDFPNPVGLAAGFDKDAKLFNELSHFGFGFIEVGTLTPVAQPGNPKPRMFRLPKDNGLINRMGFNNEGVAAAAIRLKKRNKNLIILPLGASMVKIIATKDSVKFIDDKGKITSFHVGDKIPNSPTQYKIIRMIITICSLFIF